MDSTEAEARNDRARADAHDALTELEQATIARCREEFAAAHENDLRRAHLEGATEATKIEREACAKVAEEHCDDPPSVVAAAIRARF